MSWREWKNKFGLKNMAIYDVPYDGNCQFTSISKCLGARYQGGIGPDELRRLAGDQLLKEDKSFFEQMINNYKIEYDEDRKEHLHGQHFVGHWNPHKIDTPYEMREIIMCCDRNYSNYQGDNHTLSLLAHALNINIIIFNEKDMSCYIDGKIDHKTFDENLMIDDKETICLLHITSKKKLGAGQHYQPLALIYPIDGIFKVYGLFKEIPSTLKEFLIKDQKQKYFRYQTLYHLNELKKLDKNYNSQYQEDIDKLIFKIRENF